MELDGKAKLLRHGLIYWQVSTLGPGDQNPKLDAFTEQRFEPMCLHHPLFPRVLSILTSGPLRDKFHNPQSLMLGLELQLLYFSTSSSGNLYVYLRVNSNYEIKFFLMGNCLFTPENNFKNSVKLNST